MREDASRTRDDTIERERSFSLHFSFLRNITEVILHFEYILARFGGTVNVALSERSHLVNGFKRDRSTPSRERRAQEASI